MFTSPRGRTARTWISLLAVAVGACGGDSDPSVPTEISLNTALLAFTSVGTTQQLTATVLDQRGDPLSGASVTWSSSSDVVATVSPTGLVTATGPGTAEITAASGEASTTADVSVTQVLATFEQISGNGQATVAGQTLPQPLVVRTRDAAGTAIPNLTVHFEATQGGGSVTPQEIQTGPDGTASAIFTLGGTAGQPQEVVASVVGTASSTTFTATATNPAALIEVFTGNGQSAPAGGNVPIAPAVRALDADDQPVLGVLVRFQVTGGDGAVTGDLKTTNAEGIATLDSWTLGPSGTNTLSVSVDGQTVAGEPLMFVATTNAATGYDITVRYLGTPSSSQLLAFAQAEIRWEGLITGDLANIPLSVPANDKECPGLPAISETVDDLLIFADLQPIDGPGNIVGRAGSCLQRGSDTLPVLGVMFFDTDDLDLLESVEVLDEVAVHEMGHVIGFGTLWQVQELLADPVQFGGVDPHFTGAQALVAFDAAGGTDYDGGEKVPVEDQGGPGTADAHWRESVFDNELMTGELNLGSMPLSAITVRSLADQGYAVEVAGADAYTLPSGPGLRAAGDRGRIFVLRDEVLRRPIRRVDGTGQLVQGDAR